MGDLSAKMDEARNTLLLAQNYMTGLGAEFSRLSKIKLSDAKVLEYINMLLPIDENSTDTHKKNIQRIREDLKFVILTLPIFTMSGKTVIVLYARYQILLLMPDRSAKPQTIARICLLKP